MVLKGKVTAASDGYNLNKGFAHLAAGLTCGLCGLGAGYAIGIVGMSFKNIFEFSNIFKNTCDTKRFFLFEK